MPTFSYDAKNKTGERVSGIIDAIESRGAAEQLREQGLWPTRIELVRSAPSAFISPPASGPMNSVPEIGSNGFGAASSAPVNPVVGAQSRIDAAPFLSSVPLPTLVVMYRQMATLMNAGVPMVQAITTLTQQTTNGRLRQILGECTQAVAGGNPLSSVMARYPSVFANMEVELIKAGETSGMLTRMCNRIADYLEREIEIRRKLKKETLYPKIVLSLAGCVLLLLGFLKYGQAGLKSRLLIGVVVLVGGFAIWWAARFLNQFPAIGAAWDRFKMLIPGPGGVSRKYATARFTRALGTLYSGGVLLPNAVAIAARACGNRAIGQTLVDGIGALYNGGGISGFLAQSGLLSPIAVQMARTGEQTGSLDDMMDKVADYLESEADAKSHQLATFTGVGALILAAVVVAYIAISFYVGQFSSIMKEAG